MQEHSPYPKYGVFVATKHLLWVWAPLRANSKAVNCRRNVAGDWLVWLVLSIRSGELQMLSNEVGLGAWNDLGASLALVGGGDVVVANLLVEGVTRLLRLSWLVILGRSTRALLASKLGVRADEAVGVVSTR